LTFKNLKLAPR